MWMPGFAALLLLSAPLQKARAADPSRYFSSHVRTSTAFGAFPGGLFATPRGRPNPAPVPIRGLSADLAGPGLQDGCGASSVSCRAGKVIAGNAAVDAPLIIHVLDVSSFDVALADDPYVVGAALSLGGVSQAVMLGDGVRIVFSTFGDVSGQTPGVGVLDTSSGSVAALALSQFEALTVSRDERYLYLASGSDLLRYDTSLGGAPQLVLQLPPQETFLGLGTEPGGQIIACGRNTYCWDLTCGFVYHIDPVTQTIVMSAAGSAVAGVVPDPSLGLDVGVEPVIFWMGFPQLPRLVTVDPSSGAYSVLAHAPPATGWGAGTGVAVSP